MDTKNIDGLASLVSAMGWKPELRTVLGDDSGEWFYIGAVSYFVKQARGMVAHGAENSS